MKFSWDFSECDTDGEKVIITKKFKLKKANYHCPSCGQLKWFYSLPEEVKDEFTDGNMMCVKCEETFLIIPTWDLPKELNEKGLVING